MDCAWVTGRCAPAPGAAGTLAKYLARRPAATRPPSSGCGVQARTTEGLAEELPDLPRCAATTSSPRRRRASIAEMAAMFPALRFRDLRVSTRGPCTRLTWWSRPCQSSVNPKPDLDAGMLKEGGLAISLDYDSAWTGAATARSVTSSARTTSASCWRPRNRRLLRRHTCHHQCRPWRIGRGPQARGGRATTERIFSMNMGIAVDDMMTAKVVYERALELGAGVRLPL